MKLTDASTLCKSLMNQHGLSTWTFRWNRAKKVYGQCNSTRRIISLSKNLTVLRDEESIKNTILHEIAHAIVGCNHGHNFKWRSKFISIGGNGNRCSNDVDVNKAFTPKYVMINTLDNTLVQVYHRTPSAKVFRNIKEYAVKGQRETLGHLALEPFSQKHEHLI